jgi:predicted nucleic acid-binding Zn ribbon protein
VKHGSFFDQGITPNWKKRLKSLNRICHKCGKGIPMWEKSYYYHAACKKIIEQERREERRAKKILDAITDVKYKK